MRINKFISYLLCNKGIVVNLHKLHFSSFSFFSPTKQKSFLSSHFSTPSTKHIREKTKYFPSFHNFLSSHFSTPSSKRSLSLSCFFLPSPLFDSWLFSHSSSSSKGRLGYVTHIHINLRTLLFSPYLSHTHTHTPLFLSLHISFPFQWKISTDSNCITQTNPPTSMILALTFRMGVRPTKSRSLFSPATHVWLFGPSS